MLTTNKALLAKADKGKYAVGAFNVNNLEFIKAVIKAAELEQSPVIVQTTEGAVKYAGIEYLVALAKTAAKLTKIPMSLHLDHGRDLKVIKAAIDAGYTSVMIDASHVPFEENIKMTKQVVAWAHKKGVSVEAELGTIGGSEDLVSAKQIILTDVATAVKFVKATKCDALAVAIGTSHGAYKFSGASKLDLKRLDELKKALKMPLVLHGASGIPKNIVDMAKQYGADLGDPHGVNDEDVKAAVKLGINKVNIDSDLRLAFDAGLRKELAMEPKEFDPRKILQPAADLITEVVRAKMQLLGSSGKA